MRIERAFERDGRSELDGAADARSRRLREGEGTAEKQSGDRREPGEPIKRVHCTEYFQSRANAGRRLERTVTDKWQRKTADFRTVDARTYYDVVSLDGAVAWEELPGGVSLRTELSVRGMRFATAHGLAYERTDGSVPSIIFACGEDGRHGNFHPRTYEAICARPEWKRRLAKVHTAHKRMRVRADWKWMELDCANSSDALLMNVFCHPGVVECAGVRATLGIAADAVPEFGVKPRTPLKGGKTDNTEVDMRVGDLLVEAKLTESDFQSAKMGLVERYRDLEEVFDVAELPVSGGRVMGYQLIRGTLAAFAGECSFCVLCDARRPELVEIWYSVMRAVRSFELRCRLKLLTWQELAGVVPVELRDFLAEKYGIKSG